MEFWLRGNAIKFGEDEHRFSVFTFILFSGLEVLVIFFQKEYFLFHDSEVLGE